MMYKPASSNRQCGLLTKVLSFVTNPFGRYAASLWDLQTRGANSQPAMTQRGAKNLPDPQLPTTPLQLVADRSASLLPVDQEAV